MRFAPAGEYQVFPTRDKPLKPYAAVVRAAREMGPLVEDGRATRGRRRHPHAGPGAGGRGRGRAGGDRGAARVPARRAGVPALRAGCASAPHRRRARAVERAARAGGQGRAPGPRRAQRDPPPPRPGAAGAGARRAVGPARARGHVPAARVPARVAPPRARRGAAAVGAAVPAHRAARRRRAAGGGRALDLAGPAAAHAQGRRRWVGVARACACSRPGTGARRRSRSRPRRTPAWPSGSPTRSPSPVRPWWCATPGTGRSCGRSTPARSWSPCRWAPTWARTRRGWTGPASACGCRGGWWPRRPCAWRSQRALDDPGYRERVGTVAAWSAVHDGPTRAAELVERLGEESRTSG